VSQRSAIGPNILWPSSALVLAAWTAFFKARARGVESGGECCKRGIVATRYSAFTTRLASVKGRKGLGKGAEGK